MLKDHQPLQLAQGNRLAVKDIHVLSAWLWKSKADYFERQGWKEKPYRMLFQQSFHAIKTARGKAGARKWRQDLKTSFLGSHWILPYPHSRGFMRKDKEEKQFIWWPSAHHGLIRHYAKSRQTGTLAHPLPASNVKLHPVDGWQLATTLFSKDYIPYVMQPEQELIRMPENELYAELFRLREQVTVSPVQRPFPAFMLELDNSPEGHYFPSKQCPIKKIRLAKTFEECDQVIEGLWFLKRGLETYERLQHDQLKRRKRRRQNHATIQSDTDSSLVSGDEEAEYTSDEESLAVMRKKQAQVVHHMESRLHEPIEACSRTYPQWRKHYDPELRELSYRLEKVE
ncbi:AT DNA-binding motif [Fusarium denticulatum]|uniref:AT DNA-binding motif n=1 Tax=Fusarium denticulatum TaxID=48507 RepID=A0A8H5TWV1_9HYPO|nr:AT DNA-binding motif [Fusarium denticulatum]